MVGLDFQRFTCTRALLTGRTIHLAYRLSGGSQPDIHLTETLTLPLEVSPPADAEHPAVQRALRDLHVLCGVSYWKTCCPPLLDFDADPPDAEEADLWQEVYRHGLGEFFFRHQILPPLTVARRHHAEAEDAAPIPAYASASPDREGEVLLLVGGGKDSAVAREVLRHAGVPVTLISLGVAPWIRRSVAAMGDRHLVIGRTLDPQLFALNAAGALNGHVPISAIIAAATRLVALLGGWSAVVAANERSASLGNVVWRGLEINHQWSKGLHFERRWQQHAARIPGGPTYLSLLRPLTELHIGACFARHPRYFDHVTSCNANFRLRPQDEPARWCGHCPKCLFVQIILAPHLSDAAVAQVFGGVFLGAENLPLLRELLALEAHKPFECVGTPEEVAAALWRLHDQGRMAETAGMAEFRARSLPRLKDPHALYRQEMTPAPPAEDALTPLWRARLDAYLSAD